MASTARSPVQALLALVSLSLAGAAGTARPAKPSGPISYVASSVEVDYRTQHALLHNVVISQGDLRVTADRAEATGLSFENSRWTFSGDVHISSELQGNLRSDHATVEFRDNLMQSAVATGSPAEFEQTSSTTGVLARGHADSIEYTVAAATVRLTDDAWLKYGDNEITGPILVYNIKSQQLQGASVTDDGQRVHITILPKKKSVPEKKAKPGKRP